MNMAFKSAPLEAGLWLPIIGAGLVAFATVEAEKWVRRRTAARRRRGAPDADGVA
jgi:hypothetical protein